MALAMLDSMEKRAKIGRGRVEEKIPSYTTTTTTVAESSRGKEKEKEKESTAWFQSMEEMSLRNFNVFQGLVYKTEEFRDYFRDATPIRELALLKIASRPVSRSGTVEIEDVRAIPWVFSWTQNRHLLPAWYPCGLVLDSFVRKRAGGLAELKSMYENWLFFRTVVDNLQMILVKVDLMIAELYSRLEPEERIRRKIFDDEFVSQYSLAVERILQITGQSHLLEKNALLLHSISVRNPYIDPMNHIQVRLLRERREKEEKANARALGVSGSAGAKEGSEEEEKVGETNDPVSMGIMLSIVGIASGMKNTG
jgi:phosphoenolpyruvate carboxylase